MKKNLLIYGLSAPSLFLTAQTSTEKTLASIENHEEAFQFIKQNSKRKNRLSGKILTFNEEKHKTSLTHALFQLEKGDMTSERDDYEKTLYKIIDKTKTPYYRLSYIVIDGDAYTMESINTLRETLINSYKKGTPFSTLANQYSMDDNAQRGGDTGWFTKDSAYTDLEKAVLSNPHALEDIFTIDVPAKNKYYVAIQTHEPKEILEIKVLRIVEPIN
jgi:parvulin-like peptidyl-prolyl isomerase